MKKSIIRRLFGKWGAPKETGEDGSRQPELENLEPRMLFSAAPVEAPAETPDPEAAAAEEARAADEAVIEESPTTTTSPTTIQVAAPTPMGSTVVTQAAAKQAATSLEGSELEGEDELGSARAAHSIDQASADTSATLAESEISEVQEVTLVNIDGVSAGLNQTTLEAIADAAKQRWIDSGGLSGEQIAALDNITYQIADLDAVRLGSTDGYTVSVDGNAWGQGWFIDATPLSDSEFGTTLASGALSADGGIGGQIDLLTVLLHEQGHILGLGDLVASGTATGDVSSSSISAGTRLLPTPEQAAGLTPGAVEGPSFVSMTFDVTSTADSGAGSLREAIDFANANPDPDFITFSGAGIGTHTLLTQITITDAVHINSTQVGGITVNQTGVNERVFEVQGGFGLTAEATTFDTLTISGGARTDSVGGGVYVQQFADVTFDNVLIDNNSATEGGGFYVGGTYGAKVTLTDSDVTNNTAITRGGGFRNSGYDTVVTMTDGKIDNNFVNNEHGGGFYNNGQVILTNVDITNNSVNDLDNTNSRFDDSYGGGFFTNATGLHPNAGRVSITGGSITDNKAFGHGGGFWNRGGTVTIDGTKADPFEILRNSAGAAGTNGDTDGKGGDTRHGGGFWATDAATTKLNWVNFGNGVDSTDSNTVTSIDQSDADNDLRGVGGGFYQVGESKTWLTDVDLSWQRASEGGAFYQSSIQAEVHGTRVTLDDNFARVRGGAFRNATTGALVDLTDSSIDGNIVRNENGGGFYNNGTVNLDNTDVSNGQALDLDNGNRRDSHGGGFYNGGGEVNLTNGSDVRNNISYGDGAGFRNASGLVNMTDGIIDGNKIIMHSTATQHGGGFWSNGDALTNLENVIISNNETGKDTPLGGTGDPPVSDGTRFRGVGGGFWNTDGSVVNITGDSQLIGNKSEDGGAFYNTSTGSVVNITGTLANPIEIGTKADPNTARVRGAGFRSTGNTTVNLEHVDIGWNTNDVQRGAGFYADGAQIIGNNVKIHDNFAGTDGRSGDEQGGGFWLDGNGRVELTDSEINDNDSLTNGGGFYVNNGSVELTGSSVSGNYSENSGGGFFVENSGSVTMTDTKVTLNTAGDHGGGFFVEDDAKVSGLRVNIDDNLAGYLATRDAQAPGSLYGGGFWNRHRGIVELTDSTIDRNEATFRGGGIFMMEDSRVELDGVTVAENVARDGGGGIWINNANSTLRIDNSTISGNSAGYLKAANGGVLTVNQASERGGGIYQNQGLVELNHVTITNNQATERAGGIWSNNRGGREGVFLENSIVFGNFRNSDTTPIAGDTDRRITLVGANVVGAHLSTGLNGNTGGRITTDPVLGALADNGGPTLPDGASPRTHSITGTSSAAGAAIASTVAVDQRDLGRPAAGRDLGAYEADPIATTLTIDDLTIPENAISGTAFDVEVLTTVVGGTVSSVTWSVDAPDGGTIGTGTGATTTITATNPGTSPVQTVDVTVTVTSTTGQTASVTREVELVDTTATPATFAAGSIVVDKLGDVVDGDVSVGEVTLREAINAANASGAGSYGITFAAGLNTSPILASDLARLNYDTQTVDFTVGQVVTGANGASGTIVSDTDNGVNGQLLLSGVVGTFANNNALTDPLGGAALVNGSMLNNDNIGYDFDVTKSNGAVFIVGNGTANTIVSGNSLDTVFDVRPNATVYFTDLTITGGQTSFTASSDEHGGGIRVQGSTAVFQGTDITGNTAAAGSNAAVGGAIYTTSSGVNPGRVYMTGGSVSNNNAESNGGGIYMSGTNVGESIVHLTDTVIDGNTAASASTTVNDRRGGGLYITDDGNRVVLNNVTISDNATRGQDRNDGGGIAFTGADHVLEINGGSIIRNQTAASTATSTRDSDGGGLWSAATRSEVNITGTTFGGALDGSGQVVDGNHSADDGGGLYLEGRFSTYNLIDTIIQGNRSNDSGGGFMIANDTETVNITQTLADGSKIIDNFSGTEHGGGFRNDGIVNITGSNFADDGFDDTIDISGNQARVDGTLLVAGVVAPGNADRVGGGFYVTSNSVTNLRDVDVTNNIANRRGGGFFASGGAELNITSSSTSTSGTDATFVSKIHKNHVVDTGDSDGGGFYVSTSNTKVNLTDVLVADNTSQDEGGGFLTQSNLSQVNLTRVDLVRNEAQDNGGGFYNESNGSIVNLDTVLIDGNTSVTEQGGGFRNNGIVNGDTVTISNNTAVNGGSNLVGGGFYNAAGRTTLVDATITGNHAGGRGGGFYTDGGGIVDISSSNPGVFRSIIGDNKVTVSSNDGGGFYVGSAGTNVILNGVDISKNMAGDQGGGFRVGSDMARVDLTDVVIDSNTAGGHAGGFRNESAWSIVTLDDVRITNNTSTNHHAGGFWNRGSVVGKDVLIDGNVASTAQTTANSNDNNIGAGFWNNGDGAYMDLTGVKITNNASQGRGGGFYNDSRAELHLTDFLIQDNSSDSGTSESIGRGGGFWNSSNADVILTDGTIDGNESYGHGGGFYQQDTGSTVTATDVTFSNNRAGVDQTGGGLIDSREGGGFWSASTTEVNLDNVTIRDNTSTGHGGGFRIAGGTLTGQDVVIDNNTTLGVVTGGVEVAGNQNNVGGGFYTSGGATVVDLTRVEVTNNNSFGRGGGIYQASNGNIVNLTDFILRGNSTDQDTSESNGRGGGVFKTSASTLTLNRGELSENKSFGHGGGFYQESNGAVTDATNVTISNNLAGWDRDDGVGNFEGNRVGGGFWAQSGGSSINLNHVTVSDNRATRNNTDTGAGFRVDGVAVAMQDSIAFGNFRNAAGTLVDDDVENKSGGGFNVSGNNVIGVLTQNPITSGNVAGISTIDPLLVPLLDLGGTVLPGGGSPRVHAIGLAASASGTAVTSTLIEDQRGVARPNGVADIGAFEGSDQAYVNDQFSGTLGDPFDGDLELAGIQEAHFGISAFSSIADVLTAYPSFSGDIIVNGGTYATASLTGGTLGDINLKLVQDLANGENDVTITTLNGDVTDSIELRHHGTANANLIVSDGTFGGELTGPGDITKTAAGTLILERTAGPANSYGGSVTVSGGTLVAQGTVGDGTINGDVVVNGGATFQFNADNVVANGADFTIDTGGTLNMNGRTDVIGNLNGDGNVTNNSNGTGIILDDLSGTHTFTGDITGGGGLRLRSAISAGTQELTGTVNVGQVLVRSNSASNQTTLHLNSATVTASAFSVGDRVDASQTARQGHVIQDGGSVTVSGLFRIGHWPNGVSTYTNNGGTLNLTGTATAPVNPGGAGEKNGIIYLGVDGTGQFTQTGAASTSAQGVVLDARGNTVGTDQLNLDGGTLTLDQFGIKSGSNDANTSLTISLNGVTLAASAAWDSTLPMTIDSDSTIDTSGGNIELSGDLGGSGGLDKNGAGTLTVTGTNSYSGTTDVNGGTLLVNGAHTLGGSYTVNTGATLGGTGSTDAAVNSTGGTIDPGDSGIGNLGTGSLTLNGTSVFAPDFTDLSGFDALTVTGTVDLGNATFTPNAITDPIPPPRTLVLIDNDGIDPVVGTFGGLANGDTLMVGGEEFRIFYDQGDGNDVILQTTRPPETIYVDDDFFGGELDEIDGNLELPGDQLEQYLFGAFNSVADVLSTHNNYQGTLVVNGGDYGSDVDLRISNNDTLTIAVELISHVDGTVFGPVDGAVVKVGQLFGDSADSLSTSGGPKSGVSTPVAFTVTGGDFEGIISGTGSLELDDQSVGNTLTLSAMNTFTGGTTVTSGTLEVTNTGGSATGTGPVTLAGGGSLAGTGSIAGPLTAQSGSSISPGVTGFGTIKTGALALNAGSTLNVKIDSTPANDALAVTGTVTLGGALNTVLNGAAPIGARYVIIDNDGDADAVTGTFDGLPEGSMLTNFLGSGIVYQISYAGGDGNDVVLSAVSTTLVSLSGTTLTVEDTAPVGTDDNLSFSVVGNELVITDPDNILGSLGTGTVQNELNEIRVDTSVFTDLNVVTLGGDDRITIGNLGSGVIGGVTVNGGTGFDNIVYTGAGSVLAAGGNVQFDAEEIEFWLGSELTTTDGDITVNGTGGIGSTHQGIHLYGADLTAGGTGSIILNGSGGDTGNSNQGVLLTDGSTVTTANGNIDVDGQGGGDVNSVAGQGVMVSSHPTTIVTAPANPDGLMSVQVVNTSGTNPGTSTANWLNVWNALDGGAGPTGTVAGFNVVNNTSDTETLYDYAGGGGNYGVNNAIGTIAGDGPGGGPGPFAPGGTAGSDYSIRSQAFLKFTVGGTYTIALGSDDGRRIELTEANPGSAPGYTGFTARGDQVNGGFTPGDTVVGFTGGTGHNQSVGTFTVAAGDVLELDAFMYEGGGGDSGEISIAQGTFSTWTNTTNFQLLQTGLFGIQMDSSDPANLEPTVVDVLPGVVFSAGGSGTLTIDGTGGMGTFQNEGVLFDTETVTVTQAEDGLLSVNVINTSGPTPPDGLMSVQVVNTSGTNPGNNTANWLNLYNALDGGAGPTGTVAGYNVLNNTTDTEFRFDYAGGAGNYGINNAIGTINNDGPGGGSGPFAPGGTGGSNYSIRSQAFLKFNAAGTYTIALGSDDGRRIELTEANPGSAPGYTGFTSRGDQVNGGFTPGDTVVGFSGGTGHNQSVGVFTVAAGDILELDAFYYEGGGGDSGEISIASGSFGNWTNVTDFQLLQNGLFGIEMDSSNASALVLPPTTPGNDTANWLSIWDALDGGAAPTGLVAGFEVLENTKDTETVFDYAGGGGNFGTDNAIGTINNDGPGGGTGPFAPVGAAGNNYSIRSQGYLRFTVGGTYTIAMGSSDGRRIELTDATPGLGSAVFDGFSARNGHVNGAFSAGDTVVGFSGFSAVHNISLGTFTVEAGDILELDAFYYEGGGDDSGEISIASGAHLGFNTSFSLLQTGVLGIEVDSSDPAALAPPTTVAPVSASVENGDMTITGTGGGSLGDSSGVSVIGAGLTSTGTGNIDISGTSEATGGSDNSGVRMMDGVVDTTGGSGSIVISGTGSDAGKDDNTGISIRDTDITAGGSGTVTIDGTGGSGEKYNHGVQIDGSGSTISSVSGAITIRGTGNGSQGSNRGIKMENAIMTTGGGITLTGTGSIAGTQSFNSGILLMSNNLIGGTLTITGHGGTGSSFNEGVRVEGGSMAGVLSLNGTANVGTTGVWNTGAFLLNVDFSSATGMITGTGGGGLGFNHGIYRSPSPTGLIETGSTTDGSPISLNLAS